MPTPEIDFEYSIYVSNKFDYVGSVFISHADVDRFLGHEFTGDPADIDAITEALIYSGVPRTYIRDMALCEAGHNYYTRPICPRCDKPI